MKFKDQLLYVRTVLKVAQQELTKKIGLSYTTVNRWEMGKASPSKMDKYAFLLFCKDNNIIFDNASE